MRQLCYIFILCSAFIKAQDKLFLNNGKSKNGLIVSISKDLVYFKASDTSGVERIKKTDIIMAVNYKGTRYIFGTEQSEKPERKAAPVETKGRNILGLQPFGFLAGRATFVYERLAGDGSIGIVIPLSLTYNPWSNSTRPATSVITPGTQKSEGYNFIGGLDVNFYVGEVDRFKFFIGPRVRYGTDVLLFNTQGYTIQTQCGLKIGNPQSSLVQHLSVGFGFLKVIATQGVTVSSQQLFGWYSVSYRLSIKW